MMSINRFVTLVFIGGLHNIRMSSLSMHSNESRVYDVYGVNHDSNTSRNVLLNCDVIVLIRLCTMPCCQHLHLCSVKRQ